VTDDPVHNGIVGDEGDDEHLPGALGALEWVHFIEFSDHRFDFSYVNIHFLFPKILFCIIQKNQPKKDNTISKRKINVATFLINIYNIVRNSEQINDNRFLCSMKRTIIKICDKKSSALNN
jgi:hypothetical protein